MQRRFSHRPLPEAGSVPGRASGERLAVSRAEKRRAGLRRAALCVGLCLASPAVWGCRADPGRGDPAPQAVLIGPEDFVVAEEGTIEAGPLITGALEPAQRAVLAAQSSGSVEWLQAELGDRVRRGQLLLRVQARDLQDTVASSSSALDAAERARELAERQLERTRQLVSSGTLAQNDLEVAENQLAAAEAQRDQARSALAGARERLGGALLRAPFDGVISERNVSQGDVVAPGAPLLTLIDPTSMRLRANVPSRALPLLAVGTDVEFTLRGLPDQTFHGSIERVGPAADAATRQIPVLVSLPNPTGQLVAGLFAEGRIAVQRAQGLVLPSAALEDAQGRPKVRRVGAGRVEIVDVTLGIEDAAGERVQITSGLAPGDRVLTGAARSLPAGTRVELRAEPGGAEPRAPG
jgi:RND family efflux transporter MFP subunit